ncbi:MAG: cytidine deaminase [Gammaproteobacteria bacterium]|nr:cytidine deaminase [Phycisphaerae bacterium]NIW10622.1 cytidine deaminase [Gammaproteobacteria bacterium]
MNELSPEDQSLVEEAQAIIRKRFKEGAHHIGSALRTKSGNVFVGVHVEGTIGRVAVCAEAIAIGHAATAGDTDIDTIVAVTEEGRVVPACGICRELISDYSPEANIIIEKDKELQAAPVSELLPQKYRR